MTSALSKLSLLVMLLALASGNSQISGPYLIRHEKPRLRAKESYNNMQGSLRVFQAMEQSPTILESDADEADNELMDIFGIDGIMSMPTMAPSDFPSDVPSGIPYEQPSTVPTDLPSSAPSRAPTTLTTMPTSSTKQSIAPSTSHAPSLTEPVPTTYPSPAPSSGPSNQPSAVLSALPSVAPSQAASQIPSFSPSGSIKDVGESTPETAPPTTSAPSPQPSAKPSYAPSTKPSSSPSNAPSSEPSVAPSPQPSISRSMFPTKEPTVEGCNVSATKRSEQILALLATVADSDLLDDPDSPQGKATTWLLRGDNRTICPDDEKILQRWVLAVMYFSTGGDDWLQCSDNFFALDECGFEEPFENKQRFLSAFHECEWAGITCNGDRCVTEIEFELNNLAGTIPSELGLLTELKRWGMERGRLTSSIPTEIGVLTKLTFLDLDFNQLTGSLSPELLSLTNLEQLDLNSNKLRGPINGIGVFPNMVFLQLHDNDFSGTVPSEVGTFSNLEAFTLHETDISGTMPQTVCKLLDLQLDSLIADCQGTNPDVVCRCCTDCRRD